MNGRLFDALAKALAEKKASRRELLGVLLAGGGGGLGTWPQPLPAPKEIDYFALGDSIASGHGLADADGPDPSACCVDGADACRSDATCCQTCRRSAKSYPHKVRDSLEREGSGGGRYRVAAFHHLACTGTAAIELPIPHLPPAKVLRNQVGDVLANLSTRPTLVSITVGANDLGWWDPFGTTYRFVLLSDAAFREWYATRTAQVVAALKREILRLLAPPHVAVVLTDLHNPFNKESWFFSSDPLMRVACSRRNCYQRAKLVVTILNTAYASLVGDLDRADLGDRVALARIGDGFRGHEAPRGEVRAVGADDPERRPCCGTAEPDIADTWIQHRYDERSNSSPCFGADWRGDCFHPNEKGAEHIAALVTEAGLRLMPAVMSNTRWAGHAPSIGAFFSGQRASSTPRARAPNSLCDCVPTRG